MLNNVCNLLQKYGISTYAEVTLRVSMYAVDKAESRWKALSPVSKLRFETCFFFQNLQHEPFIKVNDEFIIIQVFPNLNWYQPPQFVGLPFPFPCYRLLKLLIFFYWLFFRNQVAYTWPEVRKSKTDFYFTTTNRLLYNSNLIWKLLKGRDI